MNVLVGALFVITIALPGIIAKLRSDLCSARWMIERLTFMLVTKGHSVAEFWNVFDAADLTAFVQGQITLQELYRNVK